ncbi:hypothetical protein ABBQ32_004997 [Trebouxia sp. C0010 RCD-2024]
MPRSRSPSRSPRRGERRRDTTPMRREAPSRCSLLVRGLSKACRSEDLRYEAERYGPCRDVYCPRDYYTGEGRGLGFIEFTSPRDAEDAKYGMDRSILDGKEISVVFAMQGRKRPEDYRGGYRGGRGGGGGGYGGGGGGGGYRGDRGGGGYNDRPSYSRRRSYTPSPQRGRSYSRSRSPAGRRRSYSRSAAVPLTVLTQPIQSTA